MLLSSQDNVAVLAVRAENLKQEEAALKTLTTAADRLGKRARVATAV